MKTRFRLIHRGERGSAFYCVDTETGKRFSLKTKDRNSAMQILFAKNQAIKQPTLNRQIAKAYLAGTDAGMSTRTWQTALDAMVERKHGSTRDRWERAIKNRALDLIRHLVIVETQPEQLWQTLKTADEKPKEKSAAIFAGTLKISDAWAESGLSDDTLNRWADNLARGVAPHLTVVTAETVAAS